MANPDNTLQNKSYSSAGNALKSLDIRVVRDWTRPDPLKAENLDPEKTYKWVDKGKLEKRKYEGWQTADSTQVRYANPDGAEYCGAPQYRELVLCEMPREKAYARNLYYLEKAKKALESASRKFVQKANMLGFRTDV